MSQTECAVMRARMSAYLDGELDDTARQTLAAHLNECADCTTFFNTLRKTLMLYHATPPDALDADARTRLRHVLQLDQT